MRVRTKLILINALILILFSGCGGVEPAQSLPTATRLVATNTPMPPTATPLPSPTKIPPTATETALPTFTATPEPSPTRSAVEEHKDIVYSVPSQGQELDVYLPGQIEGSYPVILMLHQGNGRKEQFISWGKSFAKEGYAVVASNYRGWPNYNFPQNIKDAYCALGWIHANAGDYGFDMRNIYVLGQSAGGTLAALLGVIDDPSEYLQGCPHKLSDSGWVQGVITFTSIFDYDSAARSSGTLRSYSNTLLDGNQDANPENWAAASAQNWIDGTDPPFLIFHGGDDIVIPPDQSAAFAQALERAGIPVELVIVPEADHSQITGSVKSVETMLSFLSHLMQEQ